MYLETWVRIVVVPDDEEKERLLRSSVHSLEVKHSPLPVAFEHHAKHFFNLVGYKISKSVYLPACRNSLVLSVSP